MEFAKVVTGEVKIASKFVRSRASWGLKAITMVGREEAKFRIAGFGLCFIMSVLLLLSMGNRCLASKSRGIIIRSGC